MSYRIYYDTKHLSCDEWVVYSTEFITDEYDARTEVKIIFTGLNSVAARKACAALRKAFENGKRRQKAIILRNNKI